MSNASEQAPNVEHFPERGEPGSGNYVHFQNNTRMTVNFSVWYGVRYYYTLCDPKGGTGTPYQPSNQKLDYKVVATAHATNQFLGEIVPVIVLDGSKLVTLKELQDGTFGLCLSDYPG